MRRVCNAVGVARNTSELRRPESSRTGYSRRVQVSGCVRRWRRRADTHASVDFFDFAEETERLYDGLGHLRVLCGIVFENSEQDGQRLRSDLLQFRSR